MLASVGHFEAKSVVYGVQISVIAILGKQRFGINLLLLPVYCVITIVLLGHSGYNADSGVYFKSGLPLLGGHGPSRYLGNDTLTPGLPWISQEWLIGILVAYTGIDTPNFTFVKLLFALAACGALGIYACDLERRGVGRSLIVLSVFLWQHGIGRQQYAWASGLAICGFALLFALPGKFDERRGRGTRAPILMHPRWYPAVGFALACTLQGGVNGSLAILTFHQRGIVNGAAIFTASAFTSFALRYPAGRLVDRFGPRAVAVPTALLSALGCVFAASAHSLLAVVFAGLLLGTSWAAVVPVALGLLFEHSSSRTRGAAMGAYTLAFSAGAATGATVATLATLAGGGYTIAMTLCAVGPLAVLPYVLRSPRSARVLRGLREVATPS